MFRRKATEISDAVREVLKEVSVEINTDAPRRGSFEITLYADGKGLSFKFKISLCLEFLQYGRYQSGVSIGLVPTANGSGPLFRRAAIPKVHRC